MKTSGGAGAPVSCFHINISHKCEKACVQSYQGGIGSDRVILLGALLHSLRWSQDALLKDPSVMTGAMSKRLLKQKDLPTNPTVATHFIIRAQLCTCRGELSHCFHWRCTAVCVYTRSCKVTILTVSPLGLRLSLWAWKIHKHITRALVLSPSELQGEISKKVSTFP